MNVTTEYLPLTWVKLKKYCEITGDTSHSVYGKRKRGTWIDGVHCKVAQDGKLWINLVEAQKWVENGSLTKLAKLSKSPRV